MLVTLVPPAFASTPGVLDFNSTDEGVLDFNSVDESILDALGRANPSIDLSEAIVMEEVDFHGNVVYVIETARKEVFNETTLVDIAPAFLDDPAANARLVGNTLIYTLPDGTPGTIVEIVDRLGRRTLQVTEGGLRNELVFDVANEQIWVDGAITTVSQSYIFVVEQIDSIAPMSQQWTFLLQSLVDIRTPQAVARTLVGTIATLAAAAFTRNIGVTIGVATAIQGGFATLRPTHTSFYARRRMYHNPGVTQWRYVDTFYTWNARTATQRLTTRTAEFHTFS